LGDGSKTWLDRLDENERVNALLTEEQEHVTNMRDSRTKRIQEICDLWAEGGRTLQDIGNTYSMSKERVRQIVTEKGVKKAVALDKDVLVSIAEAARLTGLSRHQLNNYLYTGRLTKYKASKRVWVSTSDLRDLISDYEAKQHKPTLVERLEANLDKSTEHWLWTGRMFQGRFGILSMTTVNGYSYAHREAYKVWVGEIPEGMAVLQTCGIKHCCNPAHLYLKPHREASGDGFRAWHDRNRIERRVSVE
jgi:hypothetical protein